MKGENHPNWKGGRYIDSSGYVCVRIGNNQYLREHRLIMQESLERLLLTSECVHHINGNKQDNRIENLEIHSGSDHTKLHWDKGSLRETHIQRPNATCHPNRPHYAKGFCRLCYMNEAQKKYKLANPDKVKQSKALYSKAHREKINAYKRQRRAAGLPS